MGKRHGKQVQAESRRRERVNLGLQKAWLESECVKADLRPKPKRGLWHRLLCLDCWGLLK